MRALIPVLSELRLITGAPSISVGVLHHGEVLFTHSEGVRDTNADIETPVDLDTVYLLGSLTKGFVAAACGILVDEGKLDWNTPLSHYIPFDQVHDPVISQRANLRDALSHSTGFPQIDISWYGAGGESILGPEDLMHVISHIPVFPDFRAKFHYSNWMYSLVGRIIEATVASAGVESWGQFIKTRIFDTLGMSRSRTNRADLVDGNFAEGHTVLDNGKPARLPIPSFSDQTITGASAAVWSTVPDMLRWSKAMLDAVCDGENSSIANGSPLRQVNKILAHKFPVTDSTIHENTYGFGWARHLVPSTHLGWLSINGAQDQHVLGKDSRPRLLFYHGGQITGYLNSLYLFPETRSAVVVLTNAQGLGDCSDWVAQAIIQTLFDLEPKLDFLQISREKAEEQLTKYSKMMVEYENHRHKTTPCPRLASFTGTFMNSDIKMSIGIDLVRPGEDADASLRMELNKRKTQRHAMKHFHNDVFGFPPSSREEMELRCLVDYDDWRQFILEFNRDEEERITSFQWRMQSDFPPLLFTRQL